MSNLQLVDTSMWTCALRKSGDEAHRVRVQALMKSGSAAWCEPIRLELWRGVGSENDRALLHRLEDDVPMLAVNGETWDIACRLADVGRRSGLQFPSPDLLIFACARQHDAELVTRDKHFDQLVELWKKA